MRKSNTEEFIKKAKFIHGNKYDYSLVQYLNNKTKVEIICNIEGHKNFMQTPDAHINIGNGCPECKKCKLSYSTDTFIKKANKVHSNYYTYQSTVYTLAGNAVTVTCPVHGDFSVRANQHLAGQICMKCDIANKTKSVEEYLLEAAAIHNDKYDYSLVNYTTSKEQIRIVCPMHGEFKQRASDHLAGASCPSCAKYGFQPNKPAILYYLKITTEDNQTLYKIGITNRTVNERFNLADLQKIEIVKQKLYDNGQDALDWETKLKRIYKEYQYKGPDILSSGNTELFTEDIIEVYLSQYRMD